jgi:hypothetical protein
VAPLGLDLAFNPATMASPTLASTSTRVSGTARSAACEASPALVGLGRFGFTCKGVVYILIGLLTARTALGEGNPQGTDSQAALRQILEAPFGPALLATIAIGLVGYAAWRVVQAFLDTEHKGTDPKGVWARGGYLVSGAIHVLLALTAVQLVRGVGGGAGGEQSAQDATARLLEQPFGPWLVALVGLCIIGTGAFQLYRAYTTDFLSRLERDAGSQRQQTLVIWAGRLGFAARGVTFAIMGLFLVVAAFRQAPDEAKGLAGALDTLAQQPYGPLLVTLVAVGLAAYGVYMFFEARYRRMVVQT